MKHICIIAEAGVNHNGSVELAREMINKAKEAGVDYIKFQTFIPEKLVSKHASKANYQIDNTGNNESQLEMLKSLALTNEQFIELKSYCDSIGIGFISTPFDLSSLDFLSKLNMDFWKVPSGEITNLPYLEKIAETGMDVVLSTGMCDLSEINAAIEVLENKGSKNITLLHCNTQYPTPIEDVNLNAMNTIRLATKKEVGYSDHTVGILIPIAAAAMGATVIEKHFTLDKNMVGPDHKSSLDPTELKEMVKAIRNIEVALGSGIKTPSDSEVQNISAARKSIVAKRNINAGEVFTEDNITVKRPGSGISPMNWYSVIGQKANKNYMEDDLIEL